MVKAEKSGKRTHDTCSTETIIRRESVAFKTREPFGFVRRLLGFIQPTFY